MKIRVTKDGNTFRADPVDLTGTPPNGLGRSLDEAIGNLVRSLYVEKANLVWKEIVIDDQTEDLADRLVGEIRDYLQDPTQPTRAAITAIVRKALEEEPAVEQLKEPVCPTCEYHKAPHDKNPCLFCIGRARTNEWEPKNDRLSQKVPETTALPLEPVAVEDITPGWYWCKFADLIPQLVQIGLNSTDGSIYVFSGTAYVNGRPITEMPFTAATFYRAPSPAELMAMCQTGIATERPDQ